MKRNAADVERNVARRGADLIITRACDLDAGYRTRFPRPIEDILRDAIYGIEIKREKVLRMSDVVRALKATKDVDQSHRLADGDPEIGGFTFATNEWTMVFLSTNYGAGHTRFTAAHEAGHLANEHIALGRGGGQGDLYSNENHRDPFVCVDLFEDQCADEIELSAEEELRRNFRAMQRTARERERERNADQVAAELLAPSREVKKLVTGLAERERVPAVMSTFGISRKAATVRLERLGNWLWKSP